MKVIGWNINHRYGFSGSNMPTFVKEVVEEKKADIVVLTETSFKVPNWEKEYRDFFERKEYYVFCSNNMDVGNNDVIIAIKKKFFIIEYIKSFLSDGHRYPDHLEVHCVEKKTKKRIVIVGIRIHALGITDGQKKEEFKAVLESIKDDENVLIVGDFNNYRRGFENNDWCLNKLQELSGKHGFKMYTPSGGSIYEDNDGPYSFPEDHIFTKGKSIKICTLYDYDRTFVNKATGVYKWGTDFQRYLGKDENGENIYESIADPYPDHAIVEADFKIE